MLEAQVASCVVKRSVNRRAIDGRKVRSRPTPIVREQTNINFRFRRNIVKTILMYKGCVIRVCHTCLPKLGVLSTRSIRDCFWKRWEIYIILSPVRLFLANFNNSGAGNYLTKYYVYSMYYIIKIISSNFLNFTVASKVSDQGPLSAVLVEKKSIPSTFNEIVNVLDL